MNTNMRLTASCRCDDERKSGFAERWEAEVLAGGK
jgi:hypothetical protein